ncbi:hypothetical protein SKAU_G00164010 [Synaphobranchus kaupii]|uniref:Uncharacterized protein n=1 Tax=Synaphobranchus kaupii TaxID=118154 RepID=A0A9Q1FJ75_SYNKA|nr:hypothetical protein SKAU_G00164010 [Synaphobranchus kaupii]
MGEVGLLMEDISSVRARKFLIKFGCAPMGISIASAAAPGGCRVKKDGDAQERAAIIGRGSVLPFLIHGALHCSVRICLL